MLKPEKCPVCGGTIDLGDVNANNNTEDGYGGMYAWHSCPRCKAELKVVYDAQHGYDFDHIEPA